MNLSPETQEAFENFVQGSLATAWYFIDQNPGATRIWVYAGMNDQSATGDVAYQVQGKVYEVDKVHEALGMPVPPKDELYQPHFDIAEAASELEQVWRASGDEIPKRIIISYDTHAEEMEADFGYDNDPERAVGHIMQDWFARLAATGNDSAEMFGGDSKKA